MLPKLDSYRRPALFPKALKLPTLMRLSGVLKMVTDPMSKIRTPLCSLLGCDVPILLTGMGGVARWKLAAAVAKAGGYRP